MKKIILVVSAIVLCGILGCRTSDVSSVEYREKHFRSVLSGILPDLDFDGLDEHGGGSDYNSDYTLRSQYGELRGPVDADGCQLFYRLEYNIEDDRPVDIYCSTGLLRVAVIVSEQEVKAPAGVVYPRLQLPSSETNFPFSRENQDYLDRHMRSVLLRVLPKLRYKGGAGEYRSGSLSLDDDGALTFVSGEFWRDFDHTGHLRFYRLSYWLRKGKVVKTRCSGGVMKVEHDVHEKVISAPASLKLPYICRSKDSFYAVWPEKEKQKAPVPEMEKLLLAVHRDLKSLSSKHVWLSEYDDKCLKEGRWISFSPTPAELKQEVLEPDPVDFCVIGYRPIKKAGGSSVEMFRDPVEIYDVLADEGPCTFSSLGIRVNANLLVRGDKSTELKALIKQIVIDRCVALQKEIQKKL